MKQKALKLLQEVRAKHGLSSSTLKLVAIAGMTASHTYVVFGEHMPVLVQCLLQMCGGLTFPIMAFLLTEGYRHTSSVKRYMTRLLTFALVTQIPYWLVLGWQGNVLFTLLMGLALMALYDLTRRERMGRNTFYAITAAALVVSLILDWGLIGPLMILMMHMSRDPFDRIAIPITVAALGLGLPTLATAITAGAAGDIALMCSLLPDALYALVGIPAAGVLTLMYNGKRGKSSKWFFYAYYPAHIIVLGLLALAFGLTSSAVAFIASMLC